MPQYKIHINPSRTQWNALLARPVIDGTSLFKKVQPILDDVKANGDEALLKYCRLFDKAEWTQLKLSEEEIANAAMQVPDNLKQAIEQAAANIRRFHESQQETISPVETTEGVVCWRKAVPLQSVGLYIPGGTAPLFSTLLMLGIPAIIAGCKNILVCTPADATGKVNDTILYTASLLGLKNIFRLGGAQAIAAMAYGTDSIPAAYKIFGPGNQYVTAAKQIVSSQGTAIDMPAGPSEVAVYADETAEPSFIAADLLSQAEHGADSQVLLVASEERIIIETQKCMQEQLEQLPRKEIAAAALQNSRFIVMQDADTAFDLLNEYAPEHLIIASQQAEALAEKVQHAGSVFLGNYSPESAGDYASGTNHVLPTNGFAKTFSGVSVDSFVKKLTFQQLTEKGIRNIGSAIETMAAAEGLQAHKNAVSIRLKKLNNEI
ncbi:MAG: histidinol dehydrogenase [Ferruginibacter sp.]